MEERLRQAQKLEAIGQLAGGVAHDFNNQLAAILGYADILANELTDERLREYAGSIVVGARRSADLTEQLLTFAQRAPCRDRPVDVHCLIDEVVKMLRRSLDKRIALRQEMKATAHVVSGDETQLENALLNLGINARDAMPDGGELIFSTCNRRLDDRDSTGELKAGEYLEVSVTDTGSGIPKDAIDHIFEPFFTTKLNGKGSGMGLAAVYGAARRHSGQVKVYSEEGRGTTFRLYLPICAEPGSRPSPMEPSVPLRTTGTYNIFVVDDEMPLRKLLTAMLTSLGHTVTSFGSAADAIAAFKKRKKKVDLVILDMIMPGMSGRDAFFALREIDSDVRVLLSSGYSEEKWAADLQKEGVSGFLQKPYRQRDLIAQIAKAVGETV